MSEVVTVLTIDARGAEVGSATFVRAMATAQAGYDRIIDRQNAANTAIEKGGAIMTTGATSVGRIAAAFDKMKASLDPAVNSTLAMNRDLITLDKAVQFLGISEQQQATILDQLVLKHDAVAAAAARQADEYLALAAAGRAALAADATQTGLNASFGIGAPVNSAAESAATFAAYDQMEAKAASLRAQLDPLGTAQAKVNAQLASYEELVAAGVITETEFADAQALVAAQLAALPERYSAAGAAARGMGRAVASAGELGGGASTELLRIGNDAMHGNFNRLTSSAVVMSTRLGEAGASALTFRALLTTLDGLAGVIFNPMFLAIIAIPVALDLAVKGVEGLINTNKAATLTLEDHKKWLDQVLQGYDAAKTGADNYVASANKLPVSAAQSDINMQLNGSALTPNFDPSNPPVTAGAIAAFQAALIKVKSYRDELTTDLSQPVEEFGSVGAGQAVQKVTDAVDKAGLSSKSTKADFDGLITTLTQLQEKGNSPFAAYVAQQMLAVAKNAEEAANSVGLFNATASQLPGNSEALISTVKSYQAYLNTPIAGIQQQIENVGRGSIAISAAAAETKVWSSANIDASTDLQRLAYQAEQAAASVGQLSAQIIAAQAHSDLTFDLSLIGLTPVQQQVAKQLRPSRGDNAAVDINGPTGQDLSAQDEYDKFNQLTQSGIKPQTQAKQLLDDLGKSGKLTGDQIATLTKQYGSWVAETSGAKASAAATNQIMSSLAALDKQTAGLNAQSNSYGLSTAQITANEKAQELLAEAEDKAGKVAPGLIALINQKAAAYGLAAQNAKLAAANDEANFALSQIGRSDTDQGVASTLKGIYGGDYMSQMDGALAGQLRMNAALQQAKDISESFGDTLVDDALQGKSVTDDLSDAFGNLGQTLLHIAVNQAISAFFSNLTGGSTGGSLLSGILGIFGIGGSSGMSSGLGVGANGVIGGFASGGYTGPGGMNDPAGVVHRGEYVFDAASTARIGVSTLNAMRGMPGYAMGGYVQPMPMASNANYSNDNTSVTIAPTYHFTGTSLTEAQIKRLMADNNKQLVAAVPGIVVNARRRAAPGMS